MLQTSVLKQAQVQNLSYENDFYYQANKTHFHKKASFALGLVSEGFWNSEMAYSLI